MMAMGIPSLHDRKKGLASKRTVETRPVVCTETMATPRRRLPVGTQDQLIVGDHGQGEGAGTYALVDDFHTPIAQTDENAACVAAGR